MTADEDDIPTVLIKRKTIRNEEALLGTVTNPGGLSGRVAALELRQKIMWGAFALLGADMIRAWAGLGG